MNIGLAGVSVDSDGGEAEIAHLHIHEVFAFLMIVMLFKNNV